MRTASSLPANSPRSTSKAATALHDYLADTRVVRVEELGGAEGEVSRDHADLVAVLREPRDEQVDVERRLDVALIHGRRVHGVGTEMDLQPPEQRRARGLLQVHEEEPAIRVRNVRAHLGSNRRRYPLRLKVIVYRSSVWSLTKSRCFARICVTASSGPAPKPAAAGRPFTTVFSMTT